MVGGVCDELAAGTAFVDGCKAKFVSFENEFDE
jgi:hypothetical protein